MTKVINKKSFTIAVPLYNEEAGLKQLKDKLEKTIHKNSELVDIEVILVNDGSTDNTNDLLIKYFRDEIYRIFNHEKNLNLGGFLNTAINNCKTEFIGFLDSDCTYEPDVLFEMLKKVDLGYEIINASPLHPNGKIDGLSNIRWIISFVANLIYRILCRRNIYTSSSICKIYKTSLIKDVNLKNQNFVAITELFMKTILYKKIEHYEFPCDLNVRRFGESKIKFLPTIKSHIFLMIEIIIIKFSLKIRGLNE